MKDFSQNGEQGIILKYFDGSIGTFLSVGENDGETLSNVRALAMLGWAGVMVEPSPSAFEKLQSRYRTNNPARITMGRDGLGHDIVSVYDWHMVRAALTVTDGPIDLYDSGTHLKKGDVALLSTTVPKEMDRWKKSGEQFTKTSVRGITFFTLLRECGLILSSVPDYTDAIPPDVACFDFISIDAEGMDFAILQQIDLRAVGCRMLCIEYNASPVAEKLMRAYCAAYGMKVAHKNFENLIFTV